MRRTTRTTALALTVLILAFAGCGTDSDGAAAPPRSSAPPPTSPAATDEDCAAPPAELTTADDGRTFCVTVGGQLRLNLDGTKERPWSAVAVKGDDVLKATNAGIVVLPGDALAAYDAAAAGTARLSATRPLCATPSGPSQVSCKGIQEWTVTVRVR